MGVATAAETRYAVTTQVTLAWSVWNSDWIVGSTGMKRDCCTEYELTATASTMNVTR